MPEYYPSIGEAVGAAMAHNIRLAHAETPAPASKSGPEVDPYSVPAMLARLTETATPHEVAVIIEEVSSPLVGALPVLTELVAAAADWTRARLNFDDPHHNPTFEVWTHLAACTRMLHDVRHMLEIAGDGVESCPAELSDPRHHEMVNVLRTRDLLGGVFSDVPSPDTAAPGGQPKSAEDRQRAAGAVSPSATAHNVTPSPGAAAVPPASAPPARTPRSR